MVDVKKLETFYDFCGARATLCGDSRGRGSKTEDFLRFLQAASDPLRRFALKNCGLCTISAVRARPSAEIRVVEVQKLETFYDFCKPRATLCGDRACRSALAVAPCDFVAREMAFGSCLVARAPAFGRGFDSPLVRGSSGLKIAVFKYKCSSRSVLLRPRLENRNF